MSTVCFFIREYELLSYYRGLLTCKPATDHTAMKAPVLVRSLKLTMARLG